MKYMRLVLSDQVETDIVDHINRWNPGEAALTFPAEWTGVKFYCTLGAKIASSAFKVLVKTAGLDGQEWQFVGYADILRHSPIEIDRVIYNFIAERLEQRAAAEKYNQRDLLKVEMKNRVCTANLHSMREESMFKADIAAWEAEPANSALAQEFSLFTSTRCIACNRRLEAFSFDSHVPEVDTDSRWRTA